jgi:two-component system, LuxR family, sensor kinase FixL
MSSKRVSGSASRDAAAALHRRLLNVSRLAIFGEVAAGVAHELNQPLTAITNYAHACERLLANAAGDPLEVREALSQIATQAQRAADVARRLRERAEGHFDERKRTALNALVTELHEFLEPVARERGVQLTLILAPKLPEVLVDPARIQQVVLNFVNNSLEALALEPSAAPAIRIETSEADEDGVELAVIDNGPGLAPDLAQRAFEPFFSTRANALGLGLAVNRSLARAQGGSVGYRPNPPTGACFYLVVRRFPRE